MPQPTIIQTPGAGQFLQQGLEQGIGIGQRQQQLSMEKERTESEIAGRQKQLGLEERQVAANEAFRRGYAGYLQSRGEYYGARAKEVTQKQEDTRNFINSIQDPETKFMANLALIDPRVSQFLTAKLGQQGHLLNLAGNMWLHSHLPMDKVKQSVGLPPKPGDEKLIAPQNISQLSKESLAQSRKLMAEQAAINSQLTAADRVRREFMTTAQGAALTSPDPKVRAKYASPEGITAAADSVVKSKFPNLDKLQARHDEIMAELMGLYAPHQGAAVGQPGAPTIPDTFGSPMQGVDMNQLNDIIERQNMMFDDQLLGSMGTGDVTPSQPQQ